MRNMMLGALLVSIATVANATPPRNPTIQGTLYGGQQPVSGSHVYLLEPGKPSTTGTNSKSILNSVLGSTQEDGNGNYYVTSALTTGGFSLSGDYTCDAGQPVYIYASGGDPTSGNTHNNTAIGLMAFLGICPASGGTFSSALFINVNEASTIAVAYAVAGYGTDPTHISYDGSAAALLGITNAFLNVNNLVNQSTGNALTTNPSGGATVPQATIDTLANVLAACVNTLVSSSFQCSTLFAAATSNGTSTGVQPSNTGAAAFNIAHHPAAQVAALFDLPVGMPPFQPSLSTAPNDFTISLSYTSNGIGDPWAIAIDGGGNAWIASVATNTSEPNEPGFTGSEQGGSIVEISANGAFLSPPTGYASSFFSQPAQTPTAIAIDASGNAWVATYGSVSQLNNSGTLNTQQFLSSTTTCSDTTSLYYPQPFDGASGIAFDRDGNAWVTGPPIFKLSSTGVNLSGCGYGGATLGFPVGIAIDNVDNVWFGDYLANNVVEMNQNGTTAATYSDPSFQGPNAVAIDNQNNVWVANFAGTGVTKISSSLERVVSPEPTGITGGGLNDNAGVGIDGVGNAWVTPEANNNIGVVEISPADVTVSGANGYATGSTTTNPNAHFWTAIDSSGNVWVANTYQHSVTELIGGATPVVTPLAVGVINHTLGSIP